MRTSPRLADLLKRLLKALHRADLRPFKDLADACLIHATLEYEGAGKEAFLERAAFFFDEVVASSHVTPAEQPRADEELAAMLAPTSREVLEALSMKVADGITAQCPKGVGFALLVFSFGAGGNLAWISNANRSDMIKAVDEWIATQRRRN